MVETAPNYIEEEETFVQDAAQDNTLVLNPMTEYTFTTSGAYFVTAPRIEVLSRTLTEVSFRIPYGIEQVTITTKPEGVEQTFTYTVVL